MRCLYFIVTPQQLWSSPGLARRVLAPYFPTKISHQNHQHVVFPEHMADLRFRGRESCLRHFRGAAKTANLLRGLSLMRKSCARSFATTKPLKRRRRKGQPREAKERSKKKRTSAGGGSGWTRRQGPRHKRRAYERRGLVDQRGLKGRSGALGTSCAGDCS